MSPENHVIRGLTRKLGAISNLSVRALAGELIFDMQILQLNRRDAAAVALLKRLTAARLLEFEAAGGFRKVIVPAPSRRKRSTPQPQSAMVDTAVNIAAQTLVGTLTGN